VLGPILFIMYTADLVSLIQQHCLSPHLYSDDTQIYGACGPSDVGALLQNVTGCLIAVADWMSANWPQLNSELVHVAYVSSESPPVLRYALKWFHHLQQSVISAFSSIKI